MLLIVIQHAYKCITAYGNMGHKEVVFMRRGCQCVVDTLILYDLYLYSMTWKQTTNHDFVSLWWNEHI